MVSFSLSLGRKQDEYAKDLELDRTGLNLGPFTYQLSELGQLFLLSKPYSSHPSNADNGTQLTGLWEAMQRIQDGVWPTVGS